MTVETQLPTFSDDLRRYFFLFWRWTWLIALATILAAVTAYLVSWQMKPVYQASSTLMVNEAPGTKASDYTAVLASQRLTQTYADMLTQKPVLREVITRLNLNTEADELKEMITVQPIRDTQLIEINVEDTNPYQAAEIANVIGTVFSEQNQARQEARYASTKESLQHQLDKTQEQIDTAEAALSPLGDSPEDQSERNRLETMLTQYRQTYADTLQSYEQVRLTEAETLSNVIQVEEADPPESPVRPRILMNTALAGVVGAMLAIGAIFLMEALDDTIHGSDEIDRYLDLPVLGVIRKIDGNQAVIATIKPRSPAAEDFRSLRTNIQFASVDFPLSTILITSPTPEDGKTVIAINLSIILAQGGQQVSLIDADLRRPRIHQYMQIPNRWGLSYLFTSKEDRLDGVLRKNKSLGLSIMTSGNLPPNPAELLGSDKMHQIITEVKNQSDVIVFDSPPLNAVTDASVLSKLVDGIILVIKAGTTKIIAAQQALEQLQRVGANVIGVVLNDVDMNKARYSTYYSYYSDYSESIASERKQNSSKFTTHRKKRLS
ncbi:MAG: polysaccharide biosynthesis tyrosine autokinase [Chloroflexota bacterium]|nr:polysaccharide biosynthesis tyrosine autokinase [Chloroflexota bacterium]